MKPSARPAAPGELVLEEFVPYRLSMLMNTVSQGIARRYRDRYGLTIPQWRVMAVLGTHPGVSANELVRRIGMDKVTVHRAVSALVEKGHVLRRTDPGDRRRTSLRLSARGRSIYERIVPQARAYELELLDVLGPRDAAALERLLDRLTDRARALARNGDTEA